MGHDLLTITLAPHTWVPNTFKGVVVTIARSLNISQVGQALQLDEYFIVAPNMWQDHQLSLE